MDLSPEPDTRPLYPTPNYIASLLDPSAHLSPAQKSELISHSLTRACVFGDLTVLSYLLSDPLTRQLINLHSRDDDGIGLISLTILGFGAETERDVEREECVRLLVTHGADLNTDNAGWSPLHYGALASPATLVSYLMTHGCSPFSRTRRNLTPLDIVTGHTVLPGREDVALILSESMRSEGWPGSRMERSRKDLEERNKKRQKLQHQRDSVAKTLGVEQRWWQTTDFNDFDDDDSDLDSQDDVQEHVFTPMSDDYSTQLVFYPENLPEIFDSLITNFPTYVRNSQPANSLYMLARFACISCDDTWLEDLILGAADQIEETVFTRPENLPCLVFWLYNTTTWLHLMQCDTLLNDACDNLGIFELMEEVINSIFVFVIRFAERKIDLVLNAGMLDYTALPADLESVQFESEWSFLRPFSGLTRSSGSATPSPNNTPGRKAPSPVNVPPPPSPPPSATASAFSSIRQTIYRARGPLSSTGNVFQDMLPPPTTPSDITSFFTALHTLLTDAEVNPAFITQIWSQIMFWTSCMCEIFNRILTRKKYLCRSRSIQIGMNIGVLEEWVGQMGLPHGVQSHLMPVRDLLHWLQCLSTVQEFTDLIATVQSIKHINPLQMRRAVKDYKYEVGENRMPDECIQYLGQLQKDWERHRVHLGVEVMRKEVWKRQRDDDDEGSVSSTTNMRVGPSASGSSIAASVSSDNETAQHHIDMLFDRAHEKSAWEPVKSPAVLGELMDSRYMLPLLFPSDPRLLATSPEKVHSRTEAKRGSFQLAPETGRSASRASAGNRGAMAWKSKARRIRQVPAEVLQWVDGTPSASRWGKTVSLDANDDHSEDHSEDENIKSAELLENAFGEGPTSSMGNSDSGTKFTRRTASGRLRSARPSLGDGDP